MPNRDTPFQFHMPLSFFEKSDAPDGQRRRIAGLVTTQSRDREGETILQRGLDFSEFLDFGWFNDNHSKETDGVVGYPDAVRFVRKGEALPDGRQAPADGHWSEGFMLEGDPRADKIWAKGLALQKSGSGRRLGFSIEGVIQKRTGQDNKVIAKAKVRNVAITHCPVNTDTALVALEKALERAERNEDDGQDEAERADKALTMGDAPANNARPSGPVSGAGAGRTLTPQSLDHDKKKLTKSEAAAWFRARYTNINQPTAERLANLAFALRDRELQGGSRG